MDNKSVLLTGWGLMFPSFPLCHANLIQVPFSSDFKPRFCGSIFHTEHVAEHEDYIRQKGSVLLPVSSASKVSSVLYCPIYTLNVLNKFNIYVL